MLFCCFLFIIIMYTFLFKIFILKSNNFNKASNVIYTFIAFKMSVIFIISNILSDRP